MSRQCAGSPAAGPGAGDRRPSARRGGGAGRHGPATLCDWVHRYNASGVEGLKSRCPPGRVPALTEQQRAELRELVVKGPDPATDKVVRWRCVDLRTVVAQRFSVTVHVHTISKWLNQFHLTRLQPRPVHPKKDPEAEVTFKKNFASLAKAALLRTTAATPVPLEIWFQDEARVGQQGTHAYIWAPVGSRPLMVRDNRHDSAYLFGAICPDRGVGAAMITPHANTEAMNLHLGEVSTQVTAGARALLVCDGAGWHQRGRQLVVPDNIAILTLPAYSPELNPMERGGRLRRDSVSVPLSGSSAGWVNSVPLPGPHAGRALARPE
jgi:transposase